MQVIGADPEGSIYSNPSDVHQYKIEGVGEDFYPKAFDRDLPDEIVQVTDAEVAQAMRDIFTDTHNVAEGAGAAAFAAAMQEKDSLRGQTVGVALSGGNVDAPVFAQTLAAH